MYNTYIYIYIYIYKCRNLLENLRKFLAADKLAQFIGKFYSIRPMCSRNNCSSTHICIKLMYSERCVHIYEDLTMCAYMHSPIQYVRIRRPNNICIFSPNNACIFIGLTRGAC